MHDISINRYPDVNDRALVHRLWIDSAPLEVRCWFGEDGKYGPSVNVAASDHQHVLDLLDRIGVGDAGEEFDSLPAALQRWADIIELIELADRGLI